MDRDPSNNATESVLARLRRLVEEARAGRYDVLPEIRSLLDRYPEIWRHYGDLAKHAESKWLDLIAGDDVCMYESVTRTCNELKAKCLEGGDSPLERLLVDRIVGSHLMVCFFDAAIAVAIEAPEPRIRFLQQQLDRAQKRHAAAIKSLAEVRKLLSRD